MLTVHANEFDVLIGSNSEAAAAAAAASSVMDGSTNHQSHVNNQKWTLNGLNEWIRCAGQVVAFNNILRYFIVTTGL